MERLKIEDPGLEKVLNWDQEFRQRIEEELEWVGQPEYSYSVELHILNGTKEIKSESVERLETKADDFDLYAFFADSGPEEVKDRSREFSRELDKFSSNMNQAPFRDMDAYLNSFYHLVPEVELMDQFMTSADLSGLDSNIDAAASLESAMRDSGNYKFNSVKIGAGKTSNTARGAYQRLQLNSSVDISFIYTGEELDDYEELDSEIGVPGNAKFDGQKTSVSVPAAEMTDFAKSGIEDWIVDKY